MSLKTRIKNLANEQGIGLTALEAKLGFGNGTITKWDKTTPNADKLNKVAQYFGVSMDYLLNGIDQNGLSEKDNLEIMLRRLKPINKEKYNPNKNKKQVDTFE